MSVREPGDEDVRKVPLSRYNSLLLTRQSGKRVGLDLPGVPRVGLDFRGVEVASASFLDELIKTASGRGIELIVANASPQILANLETLRRVNSDREVALG
jgi:hypothetical protein